MKTNDCIMVLDALLPASAPPAPEQYSRYLDSQDWQRRDVAPWQCRVRGCRMHALGQDRDSVANQSPAPDRGSQTQMGVWIAPQFEAGIAGADGGVREATFNFVLPQSVLNQSPFFRIVDAEIAMLDSVEHEFR